MRKNYTIKDIAELAGVSKGTVDRVLHKRGKVSQQALQKINSILDEIGYQPNMMARNLKKNRAYTIGILIPDPAIDPYWIPCIDGITDALAARANFTIHTAIYYYNPELAPSFTDAYNKMSEATIDAVLMVPLFHDEAKFIANQLHSKNIPIVIINNQIDAKGIHSFVGQNLIDSGRVAAKLLSSIKPQGSFAIIHINEFFENAVYIQKKEKGFKEFFEELKYPAEKILSCDVSLTNFEEKLAEFLSSHPKLDGLFITTSKAYMIADFISKDPSLKLSLIGYDLLEENLKHLKSGGIAFLIHQNQKRQAYLGVLSLIDYFVFNKNIQAKLLIPIDIVNTENVKYYLD